MTDRSEEKQAGEGATGDPRGGDRRRKDRRRNDRRTPPPWWRRPPALIAYGVLGTLVIVLFLNRSRPPGIPAGGPDEITTAAPGAPVAASPASASPDAPPVDAYRMADHERLVAEGDDARGRWIRVELYCGTISSMSLRGVDRMERQISELADANNRVPAAECKWGVAQNGAPRADVLLLIPPGSAEAFANAPVVDDGFVPRRRVVGTAEWIGRSEAMALRTALVLRELPGAP
jgi:hypothetical protein